MAPELLVFPPEVRDAEDYDEVLQAIARLAGLEPAFLRARRSNEGWTLTVEAGGRLERVRHADDGTVALDVVAALLDGVLERAGRSERLWGYVEADWGPECGVLCVAPKALKAWKKRGVVTAPAELAAARVQEAVVPEGPGLDEAVEGAGERMRLD